ncbi:MAG TPA: hypothetical protein VH306_11735 [Gaiellaceae bacterium]|jgi:tetratricopeptide (TPR) repeat protein
MELAEKLIERAEPIRQVAHDRGAAAVARGGAVVARIRELRAPAEPDRLLRYQDELRAAVGTDPRREVARLSNIASAYRRRDELPQAMVSATRALEVARELEDERLVGLALNGLALVQSRHPVPGPAVASFVEAREIFRRAGDAQIEGQVLANLGTLYARLGETQSARATWAEALGTLDPDSSAHERLSAWLAAHPEADPAEDETAERPNLES